MDDNEALRVVGYLLERNATRGAFVRDAEGEIPDTVDAKTGCRFCLAGALYLVGQVLQRRNRNDVRLHYAAANTLGVRVKIDPVSALTHRWDRAHDSEQGAMLVKLKAAGL